MTLSTSRRDCHATTAITRKCHPTKRHGTARSCSSSNLCFTFRSKSNQQAPKEPEVNLPKNFDEDCTKLWDFVSQVWLVSISNHRVTQQKIHKLDSLDHCSLKLRYFLFCQYWRSIFHFWQNLIKSWKKSAESIEKETKPL